MTEEQYHKKRTRLAISDAPLAERAAAIEALDKKYNTSDSLAAVHKQIEESAADISGDHNE